MSNQKYSRKRTIKGHTERDNPYYYFRANQQQAGINIYSLTLGSLTVKECDWHILAGNDERINSHCLTQTSAIK